jgi:hypothetical protein
MTDNNANDALAAPIDYSQISPSQASEWLAKATEAYRRENPATVVPTPAEADAQLKALAKSPPKPVDPIDAALTGKLQSGTMVPFNDGEIAAAKLGEFVGTLRELGFPNSGVERILRDLPVTAADQVWAKEQKTIALDDPEFVKRFLAGGLKQRHWIAGCDVILNSRVEG